MKEKYSQGQKKLELLGDEAKAMFHEKRLELVERIELSDEEELFETHSKPQGSN